LGNGWAEGVHPDDFDRCLEIYMTAFDRREPFEMEYRLHHVSGEYRWILDNGSPNYNYSGEFIGYIGSCFDINRRKQTEEALRENKEKYRLLLENTNTGIGVYSLEGKILWYNPIAIKNIGRKAGDVIGKTLADIFGAQAAQVFCERILLAAQSDHSIEYEELVQVSSGYRWYLSDYSRIKDPDGVVRSVQVMARDITERIKNEDEIRKVKEHFKALIENAPDGIVLLDAEGNFKFISPAAKRIFGLQPSEQFNGHPDEYTHPDDLNMVLSALSRILEDPSYIPTLQYRFRDKAGNWLWVESAFTNLLADPNVESILINFRDITDRKQTEEMILKKAEELELFNNLAVGREIRMVELKQEVNELSSRLGIEQPYDLTFVDEMKNIFEDNNH